MDHVLVRFICFGGLLERIRRPVEEVFPECGVDKLQEGDDVEGSELGAWRFAEEEEVEEFETYWVALSI